MFFGKKGKTATNLNPGNVDIIIGKMAQFKGDLRGAGVARIDGSMEGTVQVDGDLLIGTSGAVVAEIKAKNITVSGRVKGNLQVAGKVELLATAHVTGDITAQAIMVEEGAKFNGRSQIVEVETPSTVAKER